MMLLGVCGKKGNGKTTAGNYMFSKHGFVHTKFAATLKLMLLAMYRNAGVSEIDAYERVEGALKEAPCKILGCTPRRAMQTLGTEWGRDCINKDLWVNIWAANTIALLDHGRSVVVDDVRLENEGARVKSLGGYLVLVTGRADGDDAHVSEDLNWLTKPDFVIDNSGTLKGLHAQIDRVIDIIREDIWKSDAGAGRLAMPNRTD